MLFICVLLLLQLSLSDGFTRSSPFTRGLSRKVLFSTEDTEVESTPLLKEEVSFMEIRTGKIVEISVHPDPEASKLFVEKVDCGEPDGPRTIVSGLVEFCSAEDLLNKEVIVLCNLKPRALKGITSAGMLLCAGNDDHTQVAPLSPPSGVPVGELITFAGYESAPVEPGNKATKVWGKIADGFVVNDDMVATYKGIPFMTSQGVITATLKGSIS